MSSERLLLGWRWSWGGGVAGRFVPTASSGAREWAVHRLHRGQEEGGMVSVAGPGMFWSYDAVWRVAICSQRCRGDRKARASWAQPYLPSAVCLSSGTGIAQFCSLIIKKGQRCLKRTERKRAQASLHPPSVSPAGRICLR